VSVLVTARAHIAGRLNSGFDREIGALPPHIYYINWGLVQASGVRSGFRRPAMWAQVAEWAGNKGAARAARMFFKCRRYWYSSFHWLQISRSFFSDLGLGERASYSQVAEWAGNKGAARAVGSAMKNNPVALVVPCHRSVADVTF
jgi:O-6-methylguanine DNA methyltransferase